MMRRSAAPSLRATVEKRAARRSRAGGSVADAAVVWRGRGPGAPSSLSVWTGQAPSSCSATSRRTVFVPTSITA